MAHEAKRHLAEQRRTSRISFREKVLWQDPSSRSWQPARVRNLSPNGMLMTVKAASGIEQGTVIDFQAIRSRPQSFLPSQGRVQWVKKDRGWSRTSLLGIEFCEPSQEITQNLYATLEKHMAWLKTKQSVIDTIGMICLSIFIVMGSVIILQRNGIQQVTGQALTLMLTTSNRQARLTGILAEENRIQRRVIDQVYRELDVASAMLAQTEEQLARIRQLYAQAQAEPGTVNAQEQAADSVQLASLREENESLKSMLASVQGELTVYNTHSDSVLMAREELNMLRQKIGAIEGRIRELKQAARREEIVAQKRMDAVRLRYGNKGFLVRNGEVQQPYAYPDGKAPKAGVRVSFFE